MEVVCNAGNHGAATQPNISSELWAASMFGHHEVNDTMSQPDGTRPPQLNPTVCGCRCGRGSGSVQEGERDGEGGDGAATVVASDDSEMEEYVSYSGDTALDASIERLVPDPVVAEYQAERRARIEQFVNTTAGLLPATGVELASTPSPFLDQNALFRDYDVDSMRPEPSSDAHSVGASDTRSIRPMSPGPGIGTWVEEYHFVVGPLRLTPQHQYCRGLVASVLRDQEVVMGRGKE